MLVDLPPGWSRHKLTDVVSLPTGQVDPQSLPYRNQPLLAPDHVESATGRITELRTAESQGASSGKYVVRPGDVVLSKIRPALRKVALARFYGTCSADMYPMRPVDGLLPEVLHAELLSERFSLFAESVSGRTGIPKLNRSDLDSYEINVPPLVEQFRIVEGLEAITEVEHAAGAEVAKLSTLRKIHVEALARWGRMAMARVITDGPKNGLYKSAEYYSESGTPIVRISSFDGGPSDLTRGLLRVQVSETEIKQFGLEVGDLLINRVNTPDLVGKATAVSRLNEPTVFESNIMRCRVDSAMIHPLVLQEWLSGSVVRAYFASRTKPAVSQASINRLDVLSCPVPDMDHVAQDAFLARLNTIDAAISVSESRIAKLDSLRRALVADLLGGSMSRAAD